MMMTRLGQLLTWTADKLGFERHVITRSWTNEPYLTRWILWGKRYPGKPERAVMLHRFHRSDADEPHDHPWVFVSIIVSGGYWEVTPDVGWKDGVGPLKRRWCGPGRILFRPANWIHSVQLEPGIEPVTLILRGRKSQGWGFWCPRGFRPWREHMAATDATGSGCG